MAYQPEDCKKGPLGATESQGKSKDEKAGEASPLILFIFLFFWKSLHSDYEQAPISLTPELCMYNTDPKRREKVLRTKL